jgi:hypothetical protein
VRPETTPSGHFGKEAIRAEPITATDHHHLVSGTPVPRAEPGGYRLR